MDHRIFTSGERFALVIVQKSHFGQILGVYTIKAPNDSAKVQLQNTNFAINNNNHHHQSLHCLMIIINYYNVDSQLHESSFVSFL